jgi:hypothetical protein
VGEGPTVDPQRDRAGKLPDIYAGPGAESAHRSMDGSEQRSWVHLAAALDAALATVNVALPLTLDDVSALFALMRAIAPPPLVLDVMHNHRRFTVRVFDGKQQIYTRELQPG